MAKTCSVLPNDGGKLAGPSLSNPYVGSWVLSSTPLPPPGVSACSGSGTSATWVSDGAVPQLYPFMEAPTAPRSIPWDWARATLLVWPARASPMTMPTASDPSCGVTCSDCA